MYLREYYNTYYVHTRGCIPMEIFAREGKMQEAKERKPLQSRENSGWCECAGILMSRVHVAVQVRVANCPCRVASVYCRTPEKPHYLHFGRK